MKVTFSFHPIQTILLMLINVHYNIPSERTVEKMELHSKHYMKSVLGTKMQPLWCKEFHKILKLLKPTKMKEVGVLLLFYSFVCLVVFLFTWQAL